MTTKEQATAKANAMTKANAGVLRCAQNDRLLLGAYKRTGNDKSKCNDKSKGGGSSLRSE
jgi:hypothetical protein